MEATKVRGSTKVPHSVIRDKRLDRATLGMLIYLMSKPRGWVFSIERIARHTHTGRDRVRALITRLEELGYITREGVREDGRNAGFKIKVKARKEGRFALIPNRHIYRLSVEAIGLLGLIAAAPPGWTWKARHLMRATGMGSHRLRRVLTELQEAGAIELTRTRDERGRWNGWRIVAVGVPKPEVGLPEADLPEADFQEPEKRGGDTSRTATGRPLSKKKKNSKKEKEGKKEDATLSNGGVNPPLKTARPKSTKGSPAYAFAETIRDEKYRKRWIGITRRKTSRGAANGIASKWPEVILPLLEMSFSARLSAAAAAAWVGDVYRDAKEHGPERVIEALKKAAKSRDPAETYRRTLAEAGFDPMNLPAPIDQNLWRVLVIHLEDVNGPMTRAQALNTLNRLEEWVGKHGRRAVEDAVRLAISRRWRNVYEPKPKEKRKEEKPKTPELRTEHPVFGKRDPWSYPWPKSILDQVGSPPDARDIDACSDWLGRLGEVVLYAEHFGVDPRDAEKVKHDWGFRL